ncbi:S41 family peptidase [Cellulophaga sp. F20128]|uniref:S41 family peptidase n=1 Tax=Cellulophaga sp. F20128 TaxID=2926413 RepID=UPI001FF58041|nr:S41 family peptidase [Cellulophaga sp. F20128]MCK0157692.1 S41 family peptidase [Cellulophaga sp. F20128]
MKKTVYLLSGLILFLSACNKNDDDGDTSGDVALKSEVNKFIWDGLNYWYYWQPNVDALADTKDDDVNSFNTYLNSYNSSEDLFDALVYSSKDDFSWYIDDVAEQLNSFNGISKSYGITRGPFVQVSGTTNVVQVVAYTTPDSPAAIAGIKRGDIISKIDGTILTTENYLLINNLYTEENISLGFATVSEDNTITQTTEKSITAATISENPVHFTSVIEEGGKKIGYLVYNGFRGTYNGELNDVFGEFKAAGIDELILDFRYNGGGSVLTSALLASMIDGGAPAESNAAIFAKLTYNSKRNASNGSLYPFFDEVYLYNKATGDYDGTTAMNRLSDITKLYVITTGKTASASEMIINGLRPYMPVTTIGETTVGKNEGSITVVDAPNIGTDNPYTNADNRSTKHTIGMQPIVFQIFNTNDENDYNDGFTPKTEVIEWHYYKGIKAFGDSDEPLLRATLDDILGTSSKFNLLADKNATAIEAGVKTPKFSNEMYIMPNDIKPWEQ